MMENVTVGSFCTLGHMLVVISIRDVIMWQSQGSFTSAQPFVVWLSFLRAGHGPVLTWSMGWHFPGVRHHTHKHMLLEHCGSVPSQAPGSHLNCEPIDQAKLLSHGSEGHIGSLNVLDGKRVIRLGETRRSSSPGVLSACGPTCRAATSYIILHC